MIGIVATRTVLLYDIIVNLDFEIRYIWTKPWSLVRFLYHFNRVWPVLLLGCLLGVLVALATAALVEVKFQVNNNTYIESPGISSATLVCSYSYAWIPYLFSLAYESVIFALTLWKTWKLSQEFGAMGLANRLLIDGSLYYAFVLVVLLFCCVGSTFESFRRAAVTSGFMVSMTSLMCNRMILSLHVFTDQAREAGQKLPTIAVETDHGHPTVRNELGVVS
ncbi:hypothetical protein FRC10_005153 [Ceratobasidium sp. 414]|nr:hypothetical protein FRC10_005153 [Ceratobasidium sp. 414]